MTAVPPVEPSGDVFAPPAEAPEQAPGGTRRMLRFALERGLRIGVSWLVMVSFAGVLLDRPDLTTTMAGSAVLALAAWGPTTALLFQTSFLPGPPHPRLRGSDGSALCEHDVIVASRCRAAEYFLTAAPWLFLSLYVGQLFAPYGILLGVFLAIWSLRGVVSATKGTEHEVARVEAAVGRTASATRRLERLLRLAWGQQADALRHTLANVRFRDGDVTGAIAYLDAIRSPERWYVVPLRAQMIVSLDPEQARDALADPSLSDGERTLIQWLIDLHEGHPERVRAGREGTEEVLRSSAPDVAGVLHLLLAAAFAPTDRSLAERHLAEGRWGRDDLPWLEGVWPAVGQPLAVLSWPTA